MEMAAITHLGNVRENNEDAYYLDAEIGCLFAVADGMGGHRAGEVASELAIEAVKETFREMAQAHQAPVAAIQKAFALAAEKIEARALTDQACEGMGTTLTMAFKSEDVLYIGHIGDSRAFVVKDGTIKQITKDHSLVAELVRTGAISTEEAKSHPQRNVIMRALSVGCQPVADIHEIELEGENLLLICSDGLTDYLDQDEILKVIKQENQISETVRVLCNSALTQGGHDNITIVAVRFQ